MSYYFEDAYQIYFEPPCIKFRSAKLYFIIEHDELATVVRFSLVRVEEAQFN